MHLASIEKSNIKMACPIRLGLCCCIDTLRHKKNINNPFGRDVYGSRTFTLKTMEAKGIEYVRSVVLQNLEDTLLMLEWAHSNGIRVFRLTSDLFPHKSNSKAPFDYGYGFAKELLWEIGEFARQHSMRLTFHPGQYNCIGTPHPHVFENTAKELEYHATVLDLMGMGPDSCLVIHGGGVYGDKEATIKRWCVQFHQLPQCVKSRLVLENCEKSFSVVDCIRISKEVCIPVVFDSHHHECYMLLHPGTTDVSHDPTEYMEEVIKSWTPRGARVKMHVSEQDPEKRCGAHSYLVEKLPDYMLSIYSKFGVEIDIYVEAKGKETAWFHLYDKYRHLMQPGSF